MSQQSLLFQIGFSVPSMYILFFRTVVNKKLPDHIGCDGNVYFKVTAQVSENSLYIHLSSSLNKIQLDIHTFDVNGRKKKLASIPNNEHI